MELVEAAAGMMLDGRAGGWGQPGTPGHWFVGIKEVTHPLEVAETGERGCCPQGQGTLCPNSKGPFLAAQSLHPGLCATVVAAWRPQQTRLGEATTIHLTHPTLR